MNVFYKQCFSQTGLQKTNIHVNGRWRCDFLLW